MDITNRHRKRRLALLGMRFLIAAGVLLARPPSCDAHAAVVPRDLAAESAGEMSAAFACVMLVGLAVFAVVDKTFSTFERRGKIRISFPAMKAWSGLMGCVVAAGLWHFGVSVPNASRSSPDAVGQTHIDLPAHGGQVQSLGENHVEIVLKPDHRSLQLFIEGITPAIQTPIPRETLWGKIRTSSAIAGSDEAEPRSLLLHAVRQAGDSPGQSSSFAGEIPDDLAGSPLHVDVPLPLRGAEQTIRLDLGAGLPWVAGTGAPSRHDTSATKVVAGPVTAEAHDLFLTPGGVYTAADIAANGSTIPERKFVGLMANHHLNPKRGAIICPVTRTQANPKFPWVVGGKTYLFCCPPCIAEFVKDAKGSKKALPSPESYVQP